MRRVALLLLVAACARADQVAVSDGDYEGAEETMALGSPEELSHPERLPEPKQREPPPPDTNNCMDLPLDKDFTQATAPKDIQQVKKLIFAEVNKNDKIHGLVGVSINYNGNDIRGHRTGWRHIHAEIEIERPEDGHRFSECLDVLFHVADTNECTGDEPGWVHNCDASAVCVNTDGGYECECPDPNAHEGYSGSQQFGVLGSGSIKKHKGLFGHELATMQPGKCWGHVNTAACCHHGLIECDEENCVKNCLGDFKCTTDPCHASNCAAHAECVGHPGGYEQPHEDAWHHEHLGRATHGDWGCECVTGYEHPEGACQDRECSGCKKIELPDYCKDHKCPCNCECTPDYKEQGYTCEPTAGYLSYDDPEKRGWPEGHRELGGRRLDTDICVDATPPTLELIGANPYVLKQGDVYEEFGADVVDNNQELYERHIAVSYSAPIKKCLDVDINDEHPTFTYNVTYSLYTPWLSVPSVTKTRTVTVGDIDECLSTEHHACSPTDAEHCQQCPKFGHNCEPHVAECHNTIGSFYCQCPDGYDGDGTIESPCNDRVPPLLTCVGVGCKPKKYLATSVQGLFDADDDSPYVPTMEHLDFVDSELFKKHADYLNSDAGQADNLAFCEKPPCWKATDTLHDGFKVDLTSRVTLGNISKEDDSCDLISDHVCNWRVFFFVTDEAGNGPVWASRTIEVDLLNLDVHAKQVPGRVYQVLMGVATLFGALLVVILLPVLLKALYWTARAAQVAVAPASLLSRRALFEDAYWTLLSIQSFGLMDPRERMQKTALKWSELVNVN